MFFIGIFGTGAKLVPAGEIFHITCPVCKKEVRMSVQHSYSYLHAFFLPLWKYDISYPCFCPHCASVFALDTTVGKQLLQGQQPIITEEHLALVHDNHAARCPNCGAPRLPNSLFCNRCGTKFQQ